MINAKQGKTDTPIMLPEKPFLSLQDVAVDASGAAQTPFEREIAELLVCVLNLPDDPHKIAPTDALYRDGLGLDSIDLLEVAMEITGRYGFQLRSDESNNAATFASIRSLAHHVETNRTK